MSARCDLDVDDLAVAMQGLTPDEFRLGRDLRVPAAKVLAALRASEHLIDPAGDIVYVQDRIDGRALPADARNP